MAMSYDDLLFDSADRQPPVTAVCLSCHEFVQFSRQVGQTDFTADQSCPFCSGRVVPMAPFLPGALNMGINGDLGTLISQFLQNTALNMGVNGDLGTLISEFLQNNQTTGLLPTHHTYIDLLIKNMYIEELEHLVEPFISVDECSLLKIPLIVAQFGPSLTSLHKLDGPHQQLHVESELGCATPSTGSDLANPSQLANKVALMERGVISFVQKATLAQHCGAKALVCYQNCKKWPYVMTDGQSQGKNVAIPCIMVPLSVGQMLLKASTLAEEKSTSICVRIGTVLGKHICPICQEDVALNSKVMKLPCSHSYHPDCLIPWLKKKNTCPLCRDTLPTQNDQYLDKDAKSASQANDYEHMYA